MSKEEQKNLTVVMFQDKRWTDDSVKLKNVVLLKDINSEKQRIQGEVFIEENQSGRIMINILPPPEEIRTGLKTESNFIMSMWRFQYWYVNNEKNVKLVAGSDRMTYLVRENHPGLLAYDWLYRVFLWHLYNTDKVKFNNAKNEILSFYNQKKLSDILPDLKLEDDDFNDFMKNTDWQFVANLIME